MSKPGKVATMCCVRVREEADVELSAARSNSPTHFYPETWDSQYQSRFDWGLSDYQPLVFHPSSLKENI